jgi:tetratricopeptide (TPR) repeat protein
VAIRFALCIVLIVSTGARLSAQPSSGVSSRVPESTAATVESLSSRDDRDLAFWQRRIDEARASADVDALRALAAIPAIFSGQATLLIGLAERLGAVGGSDAAAATALRWLAELHTDADGHRARELARARVLSARGHVAAALDVIDKLLADESPSPDVLRLGAQLLGANGRYAEGLLAYDRYLSVAPDDAQARREQARVAGWAQQFARARRLYEDIARRYPTDRAARAETEAKRLFFAARWHEAERAYQRWLELEPGSAEATFEYGETLVAQGRVAEARAVFDRLASQPRPHARAHEARRTIDDRANPSAGLAGSYASVDGYGGQRSLAWSETAALVSMPLAADGQRTLEVGASALTFSNRVLSLPAYAATTRAISRYHWGVLEGSAALVRGARDLSYWQGRAGADLSARHNLHLRVAVDRSPVLDNLAVVRDGVMSTGPSVSALFATPDTEVALSGRARWVASNLEQGSAITLRRRVSRGATDVWFVASAQHYGWRHADVRFFSPLAFTRADLGAEWTRWLHAPQFRTDRRSLFAMRYLAGADADGILYHEPRGRLSIEHRHVALDAEVAATMSRVYRALSVRLGVRVGG